MERLPQLGDVVIVLGASTSNGQDCHPAIVTNPWSPSKLPHRMNVHLMPDMSQSTPAGSIMVYENEEAARAARSIPAGAPGHEYVVAWPKP